MDLTAIFIVGMLFVALPWLILHYTTQWKKNRSISSDDEQLLDDLYHISQRLEDRIHSIERIMDVDSPDWRRLSQRQDETELLDQKIEDRSSNVRRIS